MDKRPLIFIGLLVTTLFVMNMWSPKSEPIAPAAQVEVPMAEAPAQSVVVPENTKEEQFYVLENNYQQLVFSNVGGSLAAINLPFKSEKNPLSAVLPIKFDTTFQEDYQANDRYPEFPYYAVNNQGKLEHIEAGVLGGYSPLLRRTLMTSKGQIYRRALPQNYALNILSQDSPTPPLYSVKRFTQTEIEFETVQDNRRITKTYTLAKDAAGTPYCFNLTVKVDGDAKGLWISSGVPEVELISDNYSPALKYRVSRGQKASVEQIDLPKKSATAIASVQPDWVCNSNGFMGLIIDPRSPIGSGLNAELVAGKEAPTRLTLVKPEHNLYPEDKYPGYNILLPLSGNNQATTFRIFAGPFASNILKTVDQSLSDEKSGYTPDYIACQSFHGWFAFISEPFAKFLFFLMKAFYQFSHSWGIAIILLTIALRIMMYPLNSWSIKSTLKMQAIAPEVQVIQNRFKKDPKRAQMETMALYKQRGVNPLSGCFPLLIQMPFLIGMFDLLKSTFELRGASFIPGWIDNLTAPDVLFSWDTPIFFIGNEFHLLPILLSVVMYYQQKMSSSAPKDKSLMSDQQKQQKVMGNIMVILFTVMFYHFPSGLNIYWLSSMLLGILQQWVVTKQMKKKLIGGLRK
jgi:YidC/Oxa1 family membrane protein insertase